MRIMIGGSEVFARRYHDFQELTDEYVDYMDERGRRVPDYELSVLLTHIAAWLLGVVAERAVNELIDKLQSGKEEEEARELEETRHSELLNKIEELRKEVQEPRETPPDVEPDLAAEDSSATASALLRWARKENMRIDIVLETETEVDLKDAFEALTRDAPGSTTGD